MFRITLFIFIFLISLFACDDGKKQSKIIPKDKYLEEGNRNIESIDTTIQVNPNDFEKLTIKIFPSFLEGHSISYDVRNREIRFRQITQTLDLYQNEDYYKIQKKEQEKFLFTQMRKYSSTNFTHTISKSEEAEILKNWSQLKKANYKSKIVEMFDGATFFSAFYEKDTIAILGTNSPSSHQKNLIQTLLNLAEKHSQDSMTTENIKHLKSYL